MDGKSVTIDQMAIRDLFDRIPALGELRGAARIEAEEAIRHAVNDAIEEYLFDDEMDHHRFHCVDCGKDTIHEYYMVRDELWAAAGMHPNGGMLCLADLERRIGRLLTVDDFTAVFPANWQRHVAARGSVPEPAIEREQWALAGGR